MNITSMEKLRDAIRKLDRKQENPIKDDSIYPFWNMKDGDFCILRFLPDADETNTFFWRERQIIKMPFRGTTEEPNKNVFVQVPCIDMYGKRRCPVMEEISPWFKDPEKEDIARIYWKKKSYIFQGFVVQDPLNEKVDNPIRKLVINTSIFKIIKSGLMDPDIEDSPVDFKNGRDFKLEKTRKGSYSDYSTSKWLFKTRALSQEELNAIDNFGLKKLSDLLPKEPNDKEIEVIYELFQASLNDELYDIERWGSYYRPNLYNYDDEVTDVVKQESKTVVEQTMIKEREKSDRLEKNNEKTMSILEKLKNVNMKPVVDEDNDEDTKATVEKTVTKKVDALSILESLKKNKKQ